MGYHIACLVRTRRRRVPLAPPVGICDGWRVGEVPERPKGHAWRACVPTRYRGFESLPLRLSNSSGGPSAARVRFAHAALPRCPQTPSAGMAPLGASLPFIWGPVQCSPRSARLRPTHARLPPRAADAVGWRGASRRQPPFALRLPSKAVTVRLAPRASGGGG